MAGYVQAKYGFDKKGKNDTNCEGMQAYVVTPQNNQSPKDVKQVAVVYQGSNHPGNKDGDADWFDNDLKVGTVAEINHSVIGLIWLGKLLDKVCEKYLNGKVYVRRK